MKSLTAALAIAALTAAAPPPSPSPSASPERTLTVTCVSTPFYLFVGDDNRARQAPERRALLGQRFGLVSGPRSTLGGFDFYETNVSVVEPGYGGAHYWLSRDCVAPG
ncbi:MAG: hypothetical protein JOZ24_10205 [Candidatus Eremiobacteraeota bacterium]|nr:hypothetical protein [Candidatus Eremiobacteraeota bacterium]